MKKIIKKLLKNFGLEIKRLSNNKNNLIERFTMSDALKRCVERGLDVNTVIDVGASDGRWSKICMQILPNANYFLVEAQVEHKDKLDDFCQNRDNTSYVIAAAGPSDGEIYFDKSDLFGGLASLEPLENTNFAVKAISIDKQVNRLGLEEPFLLKLDTHGFEIPILEGAKETLQAAELVIIETYNYQLTNESLKYYEMCNYMEKIGFSPVELVDFLLRPYDSSFWQMDTFFIKSKNENFNYRSYK